MNNNFTHLHLHSQASLLDGAILIPDLVDYCKETGMNSCAITEHGVMSSAVEFYKAFTKAGLKPLLGVEMYCTDDEDGLPNENKTRDNMHMIAIAKDNEGYSRLLQLISNGALHNFYYKPRVWREHLRQLAGHAVVTSACLGGILSKKLTWDTDQYGRAIACTDPDGTVERELDFYVETFGKDFYLELQVFDNGDQFQPIYNQWLLNKGKDRDIPFVITADAHYLKEEDSSLHEMLMAMQMKKTVEEYRENSEMLYGPYFYVAPPEEMLKRAQSLNCEEAYYNTCKIAEQCNVEIELNKYEEPLFDIKQAEDYGDFMAWKDNKYAK